MCLSSPFKPCSGIGAVFNIICLVLSFIFPAKNRPPKAEGEGGGFFSRFSKKGSQAARESDDTEAIGSDVTKGDMEATGATNLVADSSRL